MTDPGQQKLWSIPGNGVLARQGSLVLLTSINDHEFAESLLDVLARTSQAGGDGRALGDAIGDQVEAHQSWGGLDGGPAVVAFGPAGSGLAFTVLGSASVEFSTSHAAEQQLTADHPSMLLRSTVGVPVRSIRATLDRAENSNGTDRFTRLDSGTVRAGGLSYYAGQPGGSSARPARPVPPEAPATPEPRMGAGAPMAPVAAEAPVPPEAPMPAESSVPPEAPMPAETPVTAEPPVAAETPRSPVAAEAPMPAEPPVAPAVPDPAEPPSRTGPTPQAPAPVPYEPTPVPYEPRPFPDESAPAPPRPSYQRPDPDTMPPRPAPTRPTSFDPAKYGASESPYGAESGVPVSGPPTAPPVPHTQVDMSAPPMPAPGPAPAGTGENAAPAAIVLGVYCKNGHFTDPNARSCLACGAGIKKRSAAQQPGPRPPLGVLVFDDGEALNLDGDYILGRSPARDQAVESGTARPLRVVDDKGMVSRVHARIHLDGWQVLLSDLGSANGTFFQPQGAPGPQRLEPHVPVPIHPGSLFYVGSACLRYEPPR